MSKTIAVFGLARFGRSLATSLYDSGVDVLAVDKDHDIVETMSGKVTYAASADLTNPNAIKELGLGEMDVVVVAIGSDLKASIISVMVAKEEGVPYVIAKAADERMGEILKKIGADKIIFPEEETGVRTAKILTSSSFLEFFSIDENLCLIEMKPKAEWVGMTLRELELRNKYKINVVAVKDASEMRSFIDPDRPLEEDTELLVILDKKDLGGIN